MADDLDELHAQAALSLLAADPLLVSFDGEVPKLTTPPYVMVYTSVAWPPDGQANALDGQAVTVQVTWTCHCVGESAPAARAVQMRVRAALLNQRPVVPGRNCNPIDQDEVQPPERDESTGRLVMTAVATYSMFSAPA